MHLRLTYPAPLLILALLAPACLIDPGVLEGEGDSAGDELGESSESGDANTSDTSEPPPETGDESEGGEPSLPECLSGTNPQGGSEPGDYVVDTCSAFTCDTGWGHGDVPQLDIAWTLAFDEAQGEQDRYPVGLVARDDELLVAVRRDAGPELARVSSEGELLETLPLPTERYLSALVEHEGTLYLDTFEASDSSFHVIASTEQGELLWDLELGTTIQQLALLGDDLLVAGTSAGEGWLRRVSSLGEVAWTSATPRPVSLAVAPSGRIVVTGSYIDQAGERLAILAPDGSVVGELPLLGDTGYLAAMHLADNTTLTGIGLDASMSDGVVQRIDLGSAELTWRHTYNRATSNCVVGLVGDWGEPTYEFFNAMAVLPDGSYLIALTEEAEYIDSAPRESPRVLHVSDTGELLAADRALWSGAANLVAIAPQGSAYVTLPRNTYLNGDVSSTGFYVRKYLP